MDKSLFMVKGGSVRSEMHTLADGQKHAIFYKVQTPSAIALHHGAERRYPATAEGDIEREKTRAAFIAGALCNEDGTQLMTAQEAQGLPVTLKFDLCIMIANGSNRLEEDVKKA